MHNFESASLDRVIEASTELETPFREESVRRVICDEITTQGYEEFDKGLRDSWGVLDLAEPTKEAPAPVPAVENLGGIAFAGEQEDTASSDEASSDSSEESAAEAFTPEAQVQPAADIGGVQTDGTDAADAGQEVGSETKPEQGATGEYAPEAEPVTPTEQLAPEQQEAVGAAEGIRVVEAREELDVPDPGFEISAEREHNLRQLLGDLGFEDAKQLGLLERFHYSEKTGWDAVVHILAGDVSENGRRAKGFHHAPSAEAFWPSEETKDGDKPATRTVDSRGVEDLYPGDPYRARAVINGVPKMDLAIVDGVKKLKPMPSDMFPTGYDGLAVLRSIVNAYDSRDTFRDQLKIVPHRGVSEERVVTLGKTPMLDGKSMMAIKIITIDDKIFSARPDVRRSELTRQSPEEIYKMLISGEGYEKR